MLTARIWLIPAVVMGLGACSRGGDVPPTPAPVTNAFAESAPLPPAETQKPATPSAAPAATKAAPPVLRTPAAVVRAPQTATIPDTALTLDLKALKKQLKETKSIGLFSKLALKNQVDDLLKQFGKFYEGKGKTKITLMDLRLSYNLLMMKVLSLLQNDDPNLATAIVSSREAIWALLSDPVKFATLEI